MYEEAPGLRPDPVWYKMKLVKTSVENTRFLRFKLKYDEPLSNIAFNLNLRR